MARLSALRNLAQTLVDEWIEAKGRYIDFGVQFAEVDRVRSGRIVPTGRTSKVYGWRYDAWLVNENGKVGGYVDADSIPDLRIHVCHFAPRHFEILCDDEHQHLLVYGSRGCGKTELGVGWLKKQIARWPKKLLSVMVQKRKKARALVERRILQRLPSDWRKPGRGGLRKSQDELWVAFRNGCGIDFLSSRVPDDARGDDICGAFIDETQLAGREARGNLLLSCRGGGNRLQTLETGTLLEGEFEDYIDKARRNPQYRVEELSITDNVHLEVQFDRVTRAEIPLVAISARTTMSLRQYEQEVGRWDPKRRRFVPIAARVSGRVYHEFVEKKHVLAYERPLDQLAGRGHEARDVTGQTTARRFRHRAEHVVGVQFVAPMTAVVLKIFRGAQRDIAWAISEIEISSGLDGTRMAQAISEEGFEDALIIADAAGRYSEGGKSGIVQLGDGGFVVRAPRRNRADRDRIASVNAMLCDGLGRVSLYVDPRCVQLIAALKHQRLTERGHAEAEMEHKEHHFALALGYALDLLYPSRRPMQNAA